VTTVQYAVVAAIVALAVVAVVRFEVLCFQDLSHRHDAELNYLSRAGWTVVIAVVIPVGGLAYLFCGRRA
jgi:heme/copper-type cytochrome/quinol oxidase subunit 4